MKKALPAILCLSLAATATHAAPLAPAEAARLEGLWQYSGENGEDACGRKGNWTFGAKMTVEFRLTGGQVSFDDGSEGAGPILITKAEKIGDTYVLHFQDDETPFRLVPAGKDGLKVTASGAEGYVGKTFRQCIAGEARSGIHLSHADMTFLATTMLPEVPRFVDSRAKAGCKARQYQFLDFDLADPTRPEISREDSDALTMARDGKKVRVPVDDDGMGRWVIEAATRTTSGYDVTITELIAPNGSRGDRSVLNIVRTRDGVSIPAWKRSYIRCPQMEN
jgi:hypothetical protein